MLKTATPVGVQNETQTVGEQIKALRQARGVSLRQLGRGAGINAGTLSRWEAGHTLPDLPELDAVLQTLEASEVQKRAILRQMRAPRAVHRLRELADAGAFMPFGGDLLWSMRQRRGWTQTELARSASVTQSQIARWERGDSWPTPTALHSLCWCLRASSDEVACLTRFGEPTVLNASFLDGAKSWDNSRWVDFVFNLMHYPPPEATIDLQILVAEQHLMQLAGTDTNRQAFADALLADVYAIHARRYIYQRLLPQAARWAERGQFLAWGLRSKGVDTLQPMTFWFGNVLVLALSARENKRPAGLRQAEHLLRDWLPALPATDPQYSWGQMSLATTLAHLKHYDEAIRLGKMACENAEAQGICDSALRWRDFAQLLLDANQPAQAIAALEQSTARWPLLQMPADAATRHHLLGAKCCVALEDGVRANAHVCAAERLITSHSLHHLQSDFHNITTGM